MKIIKLILKNWKILTRNKVSFLVITLGPLLVILLAGLAFNNSLNQEIKIGVFSEEYSEISEKFINNLEEDFELIRFSNLEDCISAIKIKGFHSCIDIPPNLEVGKGDTLNFYIDISRTNIASSIQQRIFQSLYGTTQGISEDLTLKLINTISLTEKNMLEDSQKIDKEKENIEGIITDSQNSADLLNNINLEFNYNETQMKKIFTLVESIENKTKDIRSSGRKSINLIDISGSTDESIIKARGEINSLLDDAKDASNEITELEQITNNFSIKLESLDVTLKEARENKELINTNFRDIKSNLKNNKIELNMLSDSFNRILLSIETNTLREAQSIIQPVEINEKHIITGSKIQLLFPSLIILVVMLITMMMGSSQVIFEKTNRASKRMAMAPLSFITQATSIFTTTFLINLFQIIAILIITSLAFKIHFNIITLIILILASSFFILLGMTMGYIFKTENGSLLGTLSIASVFFIVSDLILPLESMNPVILKIVEFFPFVLTTNLLRKNMFFDANITELIPKMGILIIYIIIIIGLFSIIILINQTIKLKKIKQKS